MPNDRRLLLLLLIWIGLVRDGFGQVERYSLVPAARSIRSRAVTASDERPHPAVVRVIAPERDGTAAYGSGTLVDVNDAVGLVITNWHVVRDATGSVTVVFPDGFRTAAQIAKTDKDWDLAALVCAKPNVAPVALAKAAPRPGEMLTIAGYGSGDYRTATGRCTQYLAPGPKFPSEIVELEADARQGDSGGPIFNARGELAGVLFGEAGGMTAGSYCGRVDQFLKTAFMPSTAPSGGASSMRTQSQPSMAMRPIDRHRAMTQPSQQSVDDHPADVAWGPLKPVYDIAPTSTSPSSSGFDWAMIFGRTPLEAVKTFLAIVGLLTLMKLLLRPSMHKPEPMPSD